MKQTAVEWLQEQYNNKSEEIISFLTEDDFEQAKEMEKEQIIEFADEYGTYLIKGGTMSATSYNETFKSE